MNFSITRLFSFVALAAFAGAGSSQAAVRAGFHLPVTAHWGVATLPPGDYKIEIPDHITGNRQLVIYGNGKTIYAMPLAIDACKDTLASNLQLQEQNGDYFVKEFTSGTAGQVYTFRVPKKSAPRQVAVLAKGE